MQIQWHEKKCTLKLIFQGIAYSLRGVSGVASFITTDERLQ